MVRVSIQAGLRGLSAMASSYGELVFEPSSSRAAEEKVTKQASKVANELAERTRKETRLLPYST